MTKAQERAKANAAKRAAKSAKIWEALVNCVLRRGFVVCVPCRNCVHRDDWGEDQWCCGLGFGTDDAGRILQVIHPNDWACPRGDLDKDRDALEQVESEGNGDEA